MKRAFFLMLLALPLAFGFSNSPTTGGDCTCNAPTNVHRTGSTINSLAFSWTGVIGATGYKVKYVRLSDSYASTEWTTTSTSYNFTGLTAGSYRFYFTTECGDTGASDAIVIEDWIDN